MWLNEYVYVGYCQCGGVPEYTAVPIEIFKSDTLVNKFNLFWALSVSHFLHNFHVQGVCIKQQGFGNKICISELFTVVGYFHTADLCSRGYVSL